MGAPRYLRIVAPGADAARGMEMQPDDNAGDRCPHVDPRDDILRRLDFALYVIELRFGLPQLAPRLRRWARAVTAQAGSSREPVTVGNDGR